MVDRSGCNSGGRVANFLRLIVLGFIVAAGAMLPRTATAQTSFPTQEEADAFSAAVVATSINCTDTNRHCTRTLQIPHPTNPAYAGRYVVWQHRTDTGAIIQSFLYNFTEQAAPCENRNNNPETAPGTRLSLAENSGSKCVAGCVLDVVGDPIGTKPGRVQGQPVVYYEWNQQYTGATCTEDEDPGDNEQDLEETPDPEDDRVCNPSLGVCTDDEGNDEYCTFNEDGTPSQCVPAEDYDEDGIPDEDDTQPADDENGADDGEGDESDNSAAGGAKCPHEGGNPPTCKGDGIQCNILLQQYLGRCGVERSNAAKAENFLCSISAPLVCTNLSAAECTKLALQKKEACAAEGVADALGEINDELTGGDGDEGPEVDPMSAWVEPGEGDGEVELDMGGWLSSRSCPTIPSFSVLGREISFSSMQGDICQFFSVGGMIVLLLAAFQCARILGET